MGTLFKSHITSRIHPIRVINNLYTNSIKKSRINLNKREMATLCLADKYVNKEFLQSLLRREIQPHLMKSTNKYNVMLYLLLYSILVNHKALS